MTSDNPSCFDYEYGDQMRPTRYLPLMPRLALRALAEPGSLPKMRRDIPPADVPPAKASTGRQATAKFVRDMNRLVNGVRHG